MKNSNGKSNLRISILSICILSLLFFNCNIKYAVLENTLFAIKTAYESVFDILNTNIPQENRQKFCDLNQQAQKIWNTFLVTGMAAVCENTPATNKKNPGQIYVNITSFQKVLDSILIYAKANEKAVVTANAVISITATLISNFSNGKIIVEGGTACDVDTLKISKQCTVEIIRALTREKNPVNNDAELLKALQKLDKRYKTKEVLKLEMELSTQK